MERSRISLGGIQIKFRRGSTLLKLAVLAVIILSTVALLSINSAKSSAITQAEELRGQAQQLEQDNSRLERYIQQLGTVQGIIRIAQEELGLVQPDAVIFNTNNQ